MIRQFRCVLVVVEDQVERFPSHPIPVPVDCSPRSAAEPVLPSADSSWVLLLAAVEQPKRLPPWTANRTANSPRSLPFILKLSQTIAHYDAAPVLPCTHPTPRPRPRRRIRAIVEKRRRPARHPLDPPLPASSSASPTTSCNARRTLAVLPTRPQCSLAKSPRSSSPGTASTPPRPVSP